MTTSTLTGTAAPENDAPPVLAWNPDPVKLGGRPTVEVGRCGRVLRCMAEIIWPRTGSPADVMDPSSWRWIVFFDEPPNAQGRHRASHGGREEQAAGLESGSAATRGQARAECQEAVDRYYRGQARAESQEAVDRHRRDTATWMPVLLEAFAERDEARAAYERACAKAARAVIDARDGGCPESQMEQFLAGHDIRIIFDLFNMDMFDMGADSPAGD